LEWELGCRGKKTGRKLWQKIKHYKCFEYCTDYWEAYTDFIPEEKHTQTKAETFTVEGINNVIRHYLARFHRKTHCYSKAIHMVHASLLLFTHKSKVLLKNNLNPIAPFEYIFTEFSIFFTIYKKLYLSRGVTVRTCITVFIFPDSIPTKLHSNIVKKYS